MDEFCPFCSITSGEAPASIVYANATVLAFMDSNPANFGHTLVVTKEHWQSIFEVPEKVLTKVATVVKRISDAVRKTVGAAGISILQLNGKAAGQSVMHFHVHIIPRFRGDNIFKAMGARIKHDAFEKPERKELDEIARKIRENLQKEKSTRSLSF